MVAASSAGHRASFPHSPVSIGSVTLIRLFPLGQSPSFARFHWVSLVAIVVTIVVAIVVAIVVTIVVAIVVAIWSPSWTLSWSPS